MFVPLYPPAQSERNDLNKFFFFSNLCARNKDNFFDQPAPLGKHFQLVLHTCKSRLCHASIVSMCSNKDDGWGSRIQNALFDRPHPIHKSFHVVFLVHTKRNNVHTPRRQEELMSRIKDLLPSKIKRRKRNLILSFSRNPRSNVDSVRGNVCLIPFFFIRNKNKNKTTIALTSCFPFVCKDESFQRFLARPPQASHSSRSQVEKRPMEEVAEALFSFPSIFESWTASVPREAPPQS